MLFQTHLDNLEWPNHDGERLTSILRLLSLGKLMSHFWKVKSNPELQTK